jgi:DNA polymerase-3 subunit gamma/tau
MAELLTPADDAPDGTASGMGSEYVVVARRYRPQSFVELVGQQHVAQALAGAIHSNRIGHAYLFTGARGVGKTSAARIFAKALCCVNGPTDTPCNVCDICRGITSGDDVDVIEIDGASNRGIDDIRQLRQNVNVRPSRARFKVYIIDEVHMLSRDAFNALLKTLEEPPEHVKFIFCTTEPEKIPITILSRCQRFDFAGVEMTMIAERLRQITEIEGIAVESEAIDLLARRAAGSMRDSQSLLEQIMSAGGKSITVDDVQRLLGIAADARLATMVEHLVARNAAGALMELDAAIRQGVDVGQLLDQLIGWLRDLLATSVGCPASALLYVSPSRTAQMVELGPQIGVHTLLAMLQIAEQAASRLKQTTHGRTVVELSLVRICHLEELDDLATLVEQINSGSSPAGPATQGAPRSVAAPRPTPLAAPPASRPAPSYDVKKNNEPSVTTVAEPAPLPRSSPPQPSVAPQPAASSQSASQPARPTAAPPTQLQPASLTDESARRFWFQAIGEFHDLLADHAAAAERITSAAPNRVIVGFPRKYTLPKTFCERPEQTTRLERALSALAGGTVKVEFVLLDEAHVSTRPTVPTGPTAQELSREKAQHPWVRQALEMYDARILRVEPGKDR